MKTDTQHRVLPAVCLYGTIRLLNRSSAATSVNTASVMSHPDVTSCCNGESASRLTPQACLFWPPSRPCRGPPVGPRGGGRGQRYSPELTPLICRMKRNVSKHDIRHTSVCTVQASYRHGDPVTQRLSHVDFFPRLVLMMSERFRLTKKSKVS